MTALPKKKIFTPEEYLALEENCEYRSEYDDGEILAMAGGTREHIRISSNIEKSLDKQLFGTCETFQSEMKVWVETLNKFYYPDVTVVCGEIEYYKKRRDVLENPIVLVEVLSESTKIYDKEDKFFAYQNIEIFREYLLVHQDKALIEHFVRQEDQSWKYMAYIGVQTSFSLASVEAVLNLAEVYERIDFDVFN